MKLKNLGFVRSLVVIPFLFLGLACLSVSVEQNTPVENLYEYLNEKIGKRDVVFLASEPVDFFISREPGRIIRISPTRKDKHLNQPKAYIVYFVSERIIYARWSICTYFQKGSKWFFSCEMMDEIVRKVLPHDVTAIMRSLAFSKEGKAEPSLNIKGTEI